MDPDILTEERGMPEDRKHGTDSGTAYLRRLKTHDADGSGLRRELSGVTAAPAADERRGSRRYACTGSVELRTEGGVRLWGTLKDISLHGCYVEMATTFPVGKQVNLALEA